MTQAAPSADKEFSVQQGKNYDQNYLNYKTQRQNELDLVDVVAFFSTHKLLMVIGVLSGFIAAYLYNSYYKPKNYFSEMSVRIDVRSYPAITSSVAIVEHLTSILSSPEYAYKAFEEIVKSSAGFKKNIADKNLSVSKLVALQTEIDRVDLPIAVIATKSPSNFLLRSTLPINGLADDFGPALIKGINKAIEVRNSDAKSEHEIKVRNTEKEIEYLTSLYDSVDNKKRVSLESGMNRQRLELSTLEFSISRLAKGNQNIRDFFAFTSGYGNMHIANGKADAIIATLSQQEETLNGRIDRLLKVVSILSIEKKVNATELTTVLEKLINIKLTANKYNDAIRAHEQADGAITQKISDMKKFQKLPLDRYEYYLPNIKIDQQSYESFLNSGKIEQESGINLLSVLAGAFFGGVLGLTLSSFIFALRKYRARSAGSFG